MMLRGRSARSNGEVTQPILRGSRRLLPALVLLVLVAVLSVVWLHQSALLSISSGSEHQYDDVPRSNEQKQDDHHNRKLSAESEQTEILARAQSRIPGYLPGSSDTYFGYVMRDFSSRVLSRHVVGGADVFIVSKDLHGHEQASSGTASSATTDQSYSLEELKHQNSIGMSFYRRAQEEGHRVHGLTAMNSNWWANIGTTETLPSWILLAVFDPPRGQEDANLEDALRLFSDSTVTYVVFRVTSSEAGHGGANAVVHLIQLGYKVQILSCSHFIKGYQPNRIIHEGNVINFLKAGRSKAMNQTRGDRVFNSYLFATQGLDLAIPSSREYLSSGYFGPKNGRINLPFKRCPPSAVTVDFLSDEEAAKLGRKKYTSPEEMFISNFRVACSNKVVVDQRAIARFWMSHDKPEFTEAVCVTLKSVCRGSDGTIMLGRTACSTRILPTTPHDEERQRHKTASRVSSKNGPNLLVVMIDPISRPLFAQSLPTTKALLHQMGFTSFGNHTAVGDNSGPNQAALYAGRSLSKREDIGSSDKSFSWIWDNLKDEGGYVTFKAEDGCVRNSNMVQSIRPNTTHGSVIHEMMCYDFNRPNCVGCKPAASHLADHAGRFIEIYSRRKQKWAAFVHFIDSHEDTNMLAVTLDDPIFSLLYGLRSRVKREVFDNTLIILLSDHGLHYGSFLQSREGKRERASPALFIKPPRYVSDSTSVAAALQQNKGKWTTPFDVHATIKHVMLEEDLVSNDSIGSSLLNPLQPSRNRCHDTLAIPDRYCELFKDLDLPSRTEHVEMVSPPSILSFFADIPNTQKIGRPECLPGDTESNQHYYNSAFPADCWCSTSHRSWYTCKSHPWQGKAHNSTQAARPHEYFAFVDCPNKSLHMETRVERDPAILKRLQEVKSYAKSEITKPNILFFELDSVSTAYADRHFPKTREFLESLRIQSNGDKFQCPSNVCSADFSWFSITGPNSITNQVSALSGCLTIHFGEKCNNNTKNVLCKEKDMIQYGLRLFKKFSAATVWCPPVSNPTKPISPFVFDVAKRNGYVTFFGEEFCYDESPYVTQDNVFPLEADIMVHRVHCRLAERYLRQNGKKVAADELWMGTAGDHLRCIDGDRGIDKSLIPLEHIKSMWDTYNDKPKFAFLNAIAAHDYSEGWSDMSLAAESYDDTVVAFLKHMISREDANQTVIVVRSDHGLQGGPTTVEYTTQMEHPRPWTEIVVPKSLKGLSWKHLSLNQDRLVTGFDLYRMIRDLMSSTVAQDPVKGQQWGTVPEWAINVLNSEVPKSRSCKDARVTSDFCRNERERITVAPSYGTCNLYEKRLRPYCMNSTMFRVEAVSSLASDKAGQLVRASTDPPGKIVQMTFPETGLAIPNPPEITRKPNISEHAAADVQGVRIACNPSDAGLPTSTLQKLWKISDQILAEYPGSKVSGGIFLYPRQQAMLTTILQRLSSAMMRDHGRALRVCETGFGSGHSAMLFLAASQNVTVFSFDKFDRPYQRPIALKIVGSLPGRFRWFEGDSCEMVRNSLYPQWNPLPGRVMNVEERQELYQCDVLHGSSLCPTDNIDLALRSPRGTLLTSTAMASLTDKAVYFGAKAQWRILRRQGCISDVACFEEDETLVERDLHFKQAGEKIKHKFCMAIVTGKCTGFNNTSGNAGNSHPLHDLTGSLNLTQLCRAHQVDVPDE